ncbi:MAG: hypothetical protein ACRC6V_05920 [Bacteroidales bacterium]
MGKLSGSSSSQTTESNPWGPAQDILKKILADAGSIYDAQGGINGNWIDKEIADLTPEMQEAVKGMLNSDSMKETIGNINSSAQQGMSGIGQASGALGGLTQQGITGEDINKLAGELYDKETVDRQTGELTKNVQAGLDKNVQGINQRASGSGNMGSSRAGVAEGVAIGEASDAIASGSAAIQNAASQQAVAGALGTLQGNQSTALGAAGQLGSLGLGSGGLMAGTLGSQQNILGNALTGAGILQGQAQGQLDNNWFNQTGSANAGWDNLSKYLGMAGSIGGMGGSQTTTGGNSGSASNSAIGMGSLAAGLGSLWKSSDMSMKKKIKKKKGKDEYEWEWNKSSGKKGKDKGKLAQDVLKDNPDAVAKDKKTGKLMVDYNQV